MQNKKLLFIVGGVILFIIIVTVISLALRGPKKGPAKPVALQMWGTFETSDNIQPFISAYQQKYPNVQIAYTEKNVETYEEDLLDALATGTGPDIYSIHNDWLPKYMNKLVEASPNILPIKQYRESFLDAPNQDFVKDDKIYAVPLTVDSLALYYNKDILGSAGIALPPKTWNELRQDVKRITIQSSRTSFIRSGVAMGTTSNVNRAFDIMYLLMLQAGLTPYTSDFSQATLDSQGDGSAGYSYPAADALSFFTSFSNPVSDAYTWNAASRLSTDAFADNELGFLYGYSYTRDYIMKKQPGLNFDVAPVPQPSLSRNALNFANYWGYAVSKQTKNVDYAWDFLEFISTKEQLTKYYERHKQPTSRRDMVEDQIDDPEIGVFAASNVNAKTFYKKDPAVVDKAITDMIDAVVNRGKDPSEAVSEATQQINLQTTR
jgi:multiple sugar transport system substrate-binding protein